MPKRFRLHQRSAIQRVRQHGHVCRHPQAILLFHENEQDISRFGFSASRRVGNAVARNRAKRLLRESTRHQLPLIKPGWDCLLIARPLTPNSSYHEIEKAINQLFLRAKLLKIG